MWISINPCMVPYYFMFYILIIFLIIGIVEWRNEYENKGTSIRIWLIFAGYISGCTLW